MWSVFSSGILMEDVTYGQSGLRIYDPTKTRKETNTRRRSDDRIIAGDSIIGEFFGDSDLLIVRDDDAVLISRGSMDRNEWASFSSLKPVLISFLYCLGEKVWDFPGWNERDWLIWPKAGTLYDLEDGFGRSG
ncbi:hypothetical protein GCM10009624_36270 [Gordonia sinesedis]